ncbi:MAG TPA: hypothetical protein VMW30_07115 [Candidatus Paceibacterota bacterium]|nr:hypothetical protein [Candidatus Paceibacterota bacterium]
MTTIVTYHEVYDSAHWLASPRRQALFGPLGITARTFLDPENSTRVALIMEVPGVSAFLAVIESDKAKAALILDGVKVETLVVLIEALSPQQ